MAPFQGGSVGRDAVTRNLFTPPIVLISLVQAATLLLGFLGLGIVMGSLGWGDETSSFRFRPLAMFLRNSSVALAPVPVLWTAAACWSGTRAEGGVLFKAILGFGIVLCGILLFMFLACIFSPGYQPFTFGS